MTLAKKAIITKGGLDKALQKLAQRGDWDKAHVDRFRARVRDHVRGKREPDEKTKATKSFVGGDDERVPKKRRRSEE